MNRTRWVRRLMVGLLATTISVPGLSGAAVLAAPSPDSQIVVIDDHGPNQFSWGFQLPEVTVTVGESITWVNNGQLPHSASAEDGSFDTNPLEPGSSATIVFEVPGTFAYICKPHPWMRGTVNVAS